jgi:FkbM family methyltransferase
MASNNTASVRPRGLGAVRAWLRSLPGVRPTWRYVNHRILRRDGRPVLVAVEGDEPWMQLFALSGYKLFVDRADQHIGKSIAEGAYEPHVTAVLRRMLRRGRGFLDVGANIGFHTLFAARRVGPRGRVVAVEMMPRNCDLLRASIRVNGFANVIVHQAAAAERAQTIAFCHAQGSCNGTLVSPYMEELTKMGHFSSPLTAQAVAVDDLIAADQRIHVVKMDVEGSELRALQGMDRLFRSQRPKLVFEFYPHLLRNVGGVEPRRLLETIRSYDYAIQHIDGGGAVSGPLSDEEIMARVESVVEHRHVDLLAVPQGADTKESGAGAGGVSAAGSGTGAGGASSAGGVSTRGAGAAARSFFGLVSPSFSNSRNAVLPPSPSRRSCRLMMRVYPPFRSAKRGPISLNSFVRMWRSLISPWFSSGCTSALAAVPSRARANRRACSVPFLANVMSFSTNGRTYLAFSTVVIIRSWRNSAIAKLRCIAKRCEALRFSFRPALRCRISVVSSQ